MRRLNPILGAALALCIGCGSEESPGETSSTSPAPSTTTRSAIPQVPAAERAVVRQGQSARVYTDGVVTPGDEETVRLTGLPASTAFKLDITPPAVKHGCAVDDFVCGADVTPLPGTAAFRSSARGTAVARFVMPAAYVGDSRSDDSDPQVIPFQEGERVLIGVQAFARTVKSPITLVAGREYARVATE